MKSVKEKAEAYDKVLEWATEAHKVCDGMLKEDLEHLFPELKESEDGKIIQFLIHEVKETSDEIMSYRGMNKEAVLTWLEKQGKKTESIEGFDTEFERQISHIIASTINKEYEYTEDSVKRVSNALLNYAKHEFEKHGEQNPDDIDNKFIRMRETKPANIAEFLDRLTTVEQEFLWEHIEKVKKLDREEREQKPAWSEEDERMLNEVILGLKVLKYKDSGEEEKAACQREINWLEFLKEKYTWKPSEEQIIDFENAINEFIPSSYKEIRASMKNLLKQLKKLREK